MQCTLKNTKIYWKIYKSLVIMLNIISNHRELNNMWQIFLNTFYDAHVALDKTVHSITRQPNYLVRTDGQSTWQSESGQTSTIR